MSKAEKFIEEHTKHCSNLIPVPTLDEKGNIVPEAHPWLAPDDAIKAVEIARKEMIEKACKWLKDYKSPLEELGLRTFIDDGFINDLKQAMKNE